MSDALNIKDIQILYDLKNAFNRIADGTKDSLGFVNTEIIRARQAVDDQMRYWGVKAAQAKIELEQAKRNLSNCKSRVYYDNNGRYQEPPCISEDHAVKLAEDNVRQCNENFQIVQSLRSKVEAAISDYEIQARRLSEFTSSHMENAQAALTKAIAKYESVQAAESQVISIQKPLRESVEILGSPERKEGEPVSTDSRSDLDVTNTQDEKNGKSTSPEGRRGSSERKG